MKSNKQMYNEAKSIAKRITQISIGAESHSPGDYETSIDLLKHSIVELTIEGEMGYVAELTELSIELLDQSHLEHQRLRHSITKAELCHHIITFPTKMSGLINHINTDFELNKHIANSIMRSCQFAKPGNENDTSETLRVLALFGDIKNWCRLTNYIIENDDDYSSGLGIALRTFSLFDMHDVSAHRSEFKQFSDSVIELSPARYKMGKHGHNAKHIQLFNNLMAIGAEHAVHTLIKVASVNFYEPLMLHTYHANYNFRPDTEYLNNLDEQGICESVGAHRFLTSSLYTYYLTTDTEPMDIKVALKPSVIMDILALEGSESSTGKLTYDPRKIGEMLDGTLKVVIKNEAKGDPGLPLYERIIPEAILMKSNFYRGLKVSDQLGL
jgi:hypothetical protein